MGIMNPVKLKISQEFFKFLQGFRYCNFLFILQEKVGIIDIRLTVDYLIRMKEIKPVYCRNGNPSGATARVLNVIKKHIEFLCPVYLGNFNRQFFQSLP